MKYKFTGKTKKIFGKTLHQIVCATAFSSIAAGEVGGWIEKENNLSQHGNAWVCGNAQVYGDAWVCGNAQVCGNAHVYGDAHVYGNAHVYGDAHVCGNAHVYGDAWVYGNAHVYGDAWVYGNARVHGDAHVYGDAWVYGNARVHGDAQVLLGLHKAKDVCLLQIQGSAHSVCSPDWKTIKIGCQEMTPEVWSANFERVGKGNGYSDSQIFEYKRYIDLFSLVLSEHKE